MLFAVWEGDTERKPYSREHDKVCFKVEGAAEILALGGREERAFTLANIAGMGSDRESVRGVKNEKRGTVREDGPGDGINAVPAQSSLL